MALGDLRAWLRKNKLEQLADAFEGNDIDLDILPELTEHDLEKLGVSIGNRRRLLKAIADRATPHTATPEPQSSTSSEAERRQVTVLFCDLVGSTALAGAIDPEHLGAVMRRYQDAAVGAIGRFGGFVAKFMGDGVLAYFGFPRAFEDAAERAVRAAIGIVAAVGSIEHPVGKRLQTRIGIATGLVVIGDIIGTGPAQEHSVVGETPNLAARLQALAEPDAILISEATRHLVGGMFELQSIGSHALKGFVRELPVWRVEGEASVESRFAAIRARGHVPFIGRAHEMGLLLDRWRLARHGEGQIVTVIGEAGIGKSRSIEALQEALVAETHTRIHLQCSPYHSDSALYPVIQHLARAARFAATDSPSARIEKLNDLFAKRAASDPVAIPLLAGLLSIAVPATPASLTPAQTKSATIALLVDEILRLVETDPVLLVLEDAHWADATTLELMARLVDAIDPVRLLAVVTARPDFSPPWLARSHASQLTLNRLSRAESADLVAGAAASHSLSADTVAAIVAKTDGVPLFVEELTKTVIEAAGEDGAAVPATLKDSLMARLDRLGEAREVAQIAAVIGRQFSVALLEALMPERSAELETALAKLGAAGIVFPEGRGQERGYSFKHALVRDVAYESLLLARRRDWHERIARALEERFSETAANEPELLAHHFAAAGLGQQACNYRMRAGDRAVSRAAYAEAIGHFSAGLKIAETLSDSSNRSRREMDFLLKLGPASTLMHGYRNKDAEGAYLRASKIGESLGDLAALYKAKWGLWQRANNGWQIALARDRANELMNLARRSDDSDLLLEAHHCGWATAFHRGEVATTLNFARIGLESYDASRHRSLANAFGGHDPGVCGHMVSALSLGLSDDGERAQESLREGLALAEMLEHPPSYAVFLQGIARYHQLVGNYESALASSERAGAIAEKFGMGPYHAIARLLGAWASARGAGIAEAARLVDAKIEEVATTAAAPQHYLGLAAEVLLAAGRASDALAHLDRAISSIDEAGVGLFLPEIYRLRGECLLALDRRNKGEAQQNFETAREIAVRQGAIIFERRAAASLAAISNSRTVG